MKKYVILTEAIDIYSCESEGYLNGINTQVVPTLFNSLEDAQKKVKELIEEDKENLQEYFPEEEHYKYYVKDYVGTGYEIFLEIYEETNSIDAGLVQQVRYYIQEVE